ncbi:MAG: hypothetical protein AB7Q17_09260 [Phycisphaerae bacterium]
MPTARTFANPSSQAARRRRTRAAPERRTDAAPERIARVPPRVQAAFRIPHSAFAARPRATLATAVLLASFAAAHVAAEGVLRYDLRAGDWLIFERRAMVTSLRDGRELSRYVDQIQLWCLEARDDDRLLLIDRIRLVAGEPQPMVGLIFHADTRGGLRVPTELLNGAAELVDALDVLPTLRPPAREEPNWSTPPDVAGRAWSCRELGPDAEHNRRIRVEFALDDPRRTHELLNQTRTGTYWFDPNERLVSRIEWVDRDNVSGVQTQSATVLRERSHRGEDWATRRTAESRRYIRTADEQQSAFDEIVLGRVALDAGLARVDRLWASFLSDLDTASRSPLVPLVQAERARATAAADPLRARADYARRWLNRPPPATTQPGEPGGGWSDALRGRKVVECFWSIAQPDAARMLATLRELQRDHDLRNLVVLCMNVDRDQTLVKPFIEREGPGLVHVAAEPLIRVDPIPELPCIRVRDEAGAVRGVFFGWRHGLKRELARVAR